MKFRLVLFAAITWLCVNVSCKPESDDNDNAVVVTDDKKSCDGQCSNIPPTFSCEQQKGWGHCDKEWMKGFCCKTCNECGANNDTKCGDRCIDVPPARGRETCEYYAQNGDCDRYWMEGSCCKSCENAEICSTPPPSTASQPTSGQNPYFYYIIVGIIFLSVTFVMIAGFAKFRKNYHDQESNHTSFEYINKNGLSIGLLPSNDPDLQECKISLGQINIIRPIDQGSTSCVRVAKYFPNPNSQEFLDVAIKTLNHNDPVETMKEIEIMKKCNHKNVVKFGGWLQEDRIFHIVSEFMFGGNLHKHLCDLNNLITVGDCFSFIIQILDGMIYLSHEHIVHRDLAARNCLLNSTHQVLKISDFGLSRKSDINYEYISNNDPKLPFRWIPIEAFRAKLFSTNGDVWSFGIVVWEIFMRGTLPYKELLDMQSVVNFLLIGNRLKKPEYCSPELYKIMLNCWNARSRERPNFETIKDKVNEIIKQFENVQETLPTNEYKDYYNTAISIDP